MQGFIYFGQARPRGVVRRSKRGIIVHPRLASSASRRPVGKSWQAMRIPTHTNNTRISFEDELERTDTSTPGVHNVPLLAEAFKRICRECLPLVVLVQRFCVCRECVDSGSVWGCHGPKLAGRPGIYGFEYMDGALYQVFVSLSCVSLCM